MPKGGRVAATPDCPPYRGGLPDRFGDYDSYGLNQQNLTRKEKAGPLVGRDKPVDNYRPPPGQWTGQTGMGSEEVRFTERKYLKGAETRPPTFRVKGSGPMLTKSSYPRMHDCSAFPQYKEDPWDDKKKAARAKAAAERALVSVPFKPGGSKPGPAFLPRFTSTITFRPSNLKR